MACKTTLQFYNSSNASDPRLLQSWGGFTLLLRPPWWLGLGDCWRVGKGCPLPSAPKTPSKRFKTPPRRSHDTPKRHQGTKPSAKHPSHSQGAPRRLQDAVLTASGTDENSKIRCKYLLHLRLRFANDSKTNLPLKFGPFETLKYLISVVLNWF